MPILARKNQKARVKEKPGVGLNLVPLLQIPEKKFASSGKRAVATVGRTVPSSIRTKLYLRKKRGERKKKKKKEKPRKRSKSGSRSGSDSSTGSESQRKKGGRSSSSNAPAAVCLLFPQVPVDSLVKVAEVEPAIVYHYTHNAAMMDIINMGVFAGWTEICKQDG